MSDAERLAVVLRSFRVAAGMTLREVATSCGLDYTYISMIEHGRDRPSADAITRLCAAYGTDPAPLLLDYARARVADWLPDGLAIGPAADLELAAAVPALLAATHGASGCRLCGCDGAGPHRYLMSGEPCPVPDVAAAFAISRYHRRERGLR